MSLIKHMRIITTQVVNNFRYKCVALVGEKSSNGEPSGAVVAQSPPTSSYTGDQTIGASAVPFVFATGAKGVKIKVTHATQSIRIGQGATAAEADANALLAIPMTINDGIQDVVRLGASASHFSLFGSGAGTTCTITQLG